VIQRRDDNSVLHISELSWLASLGLAIVPLCHGRNKGAPFEKNEKWQPEREYLLFLARQLLTIS